MKMAANKHRAKYPWILGISSVKLAASMSNRLLMVRLTMSQVFLRPYAESVYFYISGAATNLKLKGNSAMENRLRME